MDAADSTEESPLPPPRAHLSSSSPGYSIPIRAPLTIDSDSESCSFNSSSSSIDISSYGDEHTSLFEEEKDLHDEIVIENPRVEKSCTNRPFVRYTDASYLKQSFSFRESTVFSRAFVRNSYEESSSSDFGAKLSVPIAPLTRDSTDSDTDVDSVESDEIVQKVTMAPKVRSFNGDEDGVDDELQVEGVFSCDDVTGIETLSCVSIESNENEGCEVDCLDEVVKLSESVASSFDLERFESPTVSSSNDVIGIESLVVKLSESDELSSDSERVDAKIVSDSNYEIENETFNVKVVESDELSFDSGRNDEEIVSDSNNDIEIKTLNVKLAESDELSFDSERIDEEIVSYSNNEIDVETVNVKLAESDDLSSDSERIDEEIVSDLNNEIEIETLNVKLAESDELGSNSERFDSEIVSDSHNEIEIETFSAKLSESDDLSFDSERIDEKIVSDSNNEIKFETFPEKLAGSDEPRFDSERIDPQIGLNSDSEIEIEPVNESEQLVGSKKEEEMLAHTQRIRETFLRLALNKQLTAKVNEEGSNNKFDFKLTVLAIGKTGVGKSATINSIFGENKATTNTFNPGTTVVQEITGNIDGIQLRVIDTPGLKPSSYERSYNVRVLKSIKRFTRKHAPDVVLYVDRLDTRDVDDLHLLTLITSSLGSWVWHGCIIALTHAGCVRPNEPPVGFMAQRCRFIQEQIVRYGGNKRHTANPVWLLDNHLSYEHDVMDLDCGKVLACLDQESEDEGCDQVLPFEPVNGLRDVINHRKVYFDEYGYLVKLLGNDHWSLGCRLCI